MRRIRCGGMVALVPGVRPQLGEPTKRNDAESFGGTGAGGNESTARKSTRKAQCLARQGQVSIRPADSEREELTLMSLLESHEPRSRSHARGQRCGCLHRVGAVRRPHTETAQIQAPARRLTSGVTSGQQRNSFTPRFVRDLTPGCCSDERSRCT